MHTPDQVPWIEVLHFKIPRPALPPLGHALDYRHEVFAGISELIFDRATVNALLFADDSRLFQRSEALRQG